MRLAQPVILVCVLATAVPGTAQILNSSSWGPSGDQQATAVATDAAGNAYIVGRTDSSRFPMLNAVCPRGGGADAFLIKLNSSWNVVFATWLGGEGSDQATAVALDAAGNIYVAGSTTSTSFCGTAFPRTGGAMDGFVAKLDPTGQHLIYAVSIGGSSDDVINGIAVTADGHLFATGATSSMDLPLVQPLQSQLNGAENALLVELDPSGSTLYSSYLGGSGTDIATAIALDPAGAIWLAGSTTSSNFPVVQPTQPTLAGPQNAFVAKLSSTAGSILFSTWLGGSGGMSPPGDGANAIAVDSVGNAYVAGITNSPNFPLLNAWQSFQGWDSDAFLTSFSATGQLRFSTCLGGSAMDVANAVSILPGGGILVAGATMSSDFPQVGNSSAWHAGYDGFIAEFNNSASTLLYSGYVNLGQWDIVQAASATNPAVLAGLTASADPPMTELAAASQFQLPLPAVTLTIGVTPSASGTAWASPQSSQGSYAAGTKVCLSASANAGWAFSSWSGNALDSSGCLVLTANAAVTANFTVVQYQLTLNGKPSGAGSVSANPTSVNGAYPFDTSVCLTAVPNTGWAFSSWSGAALNSSGCLLVTGAATVTAHFVSSASECPGDFNGDGHPDLVYQSDTGPQLVVHFFGGSAGVTDLGWSMLNSSAVSGWKVVGTGDFNGDGHPDLVWMNETTRQVMVNYYSGKTYEGWAWLDSTGEPGWSVVAVADMNRDGVPDLIWQNDTTRQVTVNYYINSGGPKFSGWGWVNSAGTPGWRVVASADFNGDGVPDLVYQNDTTSQITVDYYGAGAQGAVTFLGWAWLNQAGTPGWRVVGAADFNGDGHPDLVLQNPTTRQVLVDYYDGSSGTSSIGSNWLNSAGSIGWTVVAI